MMKIVCRISRKIQIIKIVRLAILDANLIELIKKEYYLE